MATELGKAYVQIVPSARGISGAISKGIMPEANNAGVQAGKGLGGKLVAVAKTVIASAAIGKAIAASVRAGGALEQSIGGIETLFKGSANTMKNYAKQAYRTAGISANEYMEQATSFSASLISSLGGDTSKAAKTANMAIIDMSDNANKMGTSIESIQDAYQGFAKQNYTMLDNLKLGYGGTKTEMERLLADAEKLTGVKYDINNLDDVYNAIHAIQENLGITGTTAKESEETLIGSFNSMKAAATDFLGNLALGMDIKEPMANMITTASTFLFGNLLPMIGNIFKAIPEALAIAFQTLGPQMAAAGRNLMQQLGVGLSENSPLNDFIPKMQQSLAPIGDAFKQAFGQLPGLFSTIAQAVIPIIETIASGLTRLDFSGFQNLITAIIPAISNAFQTFMSIVGPAIDTVVNSFVNMWNAAQPLISVLASALMPVLQVLASFLGGVVKGALLGIAGIFDMVKIAIQFLTPIVSALVSAFSFVAPVLSKIAEWVGVAIGLFANFGTSGMNLKAIIQSAWNNIQTSIFIAKSGISSAINGIKSFFSGLGSAGGSLRNLLKTAWNAIKSAITSSGNAIRSVISRIRSFFSNLGNAGNSLRSALSSAWNAIRSTVVSVARGVISRVNAIKNIFNSLKNINLFNAGAAIMRGFLDGLKSIWGSIENFVGGIADWIKDHKGPIQYDRKLLIPAGKAIMQGLNNGLVKNFKPIMNNVNQMSQDIIDSFATDVTPINLKTDDLAKSTLQNALPVDLAQELNVGSKAYQINQQAMLNRLDAQMTTITSLLSELSDKDIEVYMDGQKVSGVVEPIITANQKQATKYYNRRRGVFA